MKHFVRIAVLAGACALASTAAYADTVNLIQNGSFESGFDNWTTGGANFAMGIDAYHPHDGAYSVSFGSRSIDSTLEQTVADTTGHTMELTFWLASDGADGNRIDIALNGNYIFAQTLSQQDWTKYTYTFTATGSDVINFGGANGPGYNHLDAISLTDQGGTSNPAPAATPEPSSLMLCGTGLLGAAGAVRRRMKRS